MKKYLAASLVILLFGLACFAAENSSAETQDKLTYSLGLGNSLAWYLTTSAALKDGSGFPKAEAEFSYWLRGSYGLAMSWLVGLPSKNELAAPQATLGLVFTPSSAYGSSLDFRAQYGWVWLVENNFRIKMGFGLPLMSVDFHHDL